MDDEDLRPRKRVHMAPIIAPLVAPPHRRGHTPSLAYGVLTGKDLKRLRKRHRLTQEQLAALVSYGHGSVSRWETNQNAIPYDAYPALAMLEDRSLTCGLAVVEYQTLRVLRLF
jgi:DNA-binding XRE family transcriptional regulator